MPEEPAGADRENREVNWERVIQVILAVIAAGAIVLSLVQFLDNRAYRAKTDETIAAYREAERAEEEAERARGLDVHLLFRAPIAKGIRLPTALEVKFFNHGHQPVFVNNVGLEFPNGSRYVAPDPPEGDWHLGEPVAPGQSHSYLWHGQALAILCNLLAALGFDEEVGLVGFCEDGDGVVHRSEPLPFNIDDALQLAIQEQS